MLVDWFTEHPRAIGESYSEHQRHALQFSGLLFRASLACFVHALVPAAFEQTASRCVMRLHDEMTRRAAKAATVRDVACARPMEEKPGRVRMDASPR